jgi:hypothetical protein
LACKQSCKPQEQLDAPHRHDVIFELCSYKKSASSTSGNALF